MRDCADIGMDQQLQTAAPLPGINGVFGGGCLGKIRPALSENEIAGIDQGGLCVQQ